MALINTSLVSDSNDTLAKAQNNRTISNFTANRYQPAQQQVKVSDAMKAKIQKYESDFTASRDVVNKRYNDIVKRYGEFYTNGISYDEKGNPIAGADATSYADRYQFAEFLHELYPDLSVEYFMKNAEDFIYRATGVKADIKTYSDHLGRIWDSAWANAGNSMAAVMEYFGSAVTDKFNTKDWQNTKETRSQKTAVSGANYRKDLGDEKYDSLFEKMLSGTWEQWPQMAMMAGLSVLSLVTGGITGASGVAGYLATKGISNTAAKAAVGNIGKVINFVISGMMDAGSVMTDLSEAGVSDEAAYTAGLAILLSTGFLETVGDDTLLKPVDKVADSIFKLGDKQVIHQATKKLSDIAKETFVNYGKQIGKAEITETVQEELEFVNEWVAKAIVASYEEKYGRMVDREELGITSEQFVNGLKETAIQTMLSTPFMTLGSNLVSTGADALFGDIAQQWTPSRYMNKEGATSVINNATVVSSSVRVNKDIKDAENGKINPVKGHRVGNYFVLDDEVSPKQADYILNGKKAIYAIEPSESKKTSLDVIGLEASAIDSGTTMTAEQADSYLASLEVEKKLDTYGYEENGKITDLNYGKARTLYVTLKDSGETIKINIGEENSGNLSGLKDLTGVEYKKFEEEDFVKPEDVKTTKKKESAAPKQEQTQQTQQAEKETVAQPPEDEDDWDVFKGTAQENTVPNDKEYLEGLKNKEKPESLRKEQTAKSFDAKAKLDSGYRAETHEYYNEKGELETKDINNVRTVKMIDKDGNTSFIRIDNLNTENFKKILTLADDFGKNPLDLQQRKNYAEKVVKQKNEAMKTAGIEKSSTEPVQRVKDTQIATQSNDSSTQQNTTEQTAETTPQATVSQEQAQTTGATTEAVEPQQAQEATAETITEEAQTSLENTTEATQPEAVTTEQAETTEEKAEEKAADTIAETVTEPELDEATETLQKDRGIEREPARGIALLAKGLKDLFKALGHEIDYKKAVSHLNVSTLANAKTLKDRISVFLDLIVDHPYGKELFKEVYGDKRITKKARAEFKEEITNVLYGRKSNLDESTHTKLEELIKPTLATVINQSELTAEEQRLAEELKQKETKKAEEDVLKKAKEEETKLTKEEKKQAKKKAKEDVEAETLDKHQKSLRNSAYWLARGAYEYWLNQSLIERKNDLNRKERLQKVANTYKEWLDKIAKGDYNTALQFVSTLEARRAEQLVGKYGDFEFEVDSKDGKKKRRLNQSALKYGEEHTADETQEERAAKKMTAREAALKEAVDAAMKLYSENRQVRTVGETQYTILTAYQLNKMNLALSGKINEEIDAIVNDILSYTPAWSKRQVIVDDNDEPVLDKDGNYQYETVSAGVADAKYISDLFAYLEGIIEAADTDISNTIASKTDNITVTDTENREEQAKAAVKDLRPVVAFAILSYFERNSQAGSFDTLIQQIGTDGFHDRIENVLSDIRLHHDDWLLTPSAINAIQNVLISDFTTRQNGVAPEKLKNQFIGEKALDNLKEKYPIFMENHKRAVELRKQGVPIEEIWSQTGWFWDTDNKWRMEIPDVLNFSDELNDYVNEQLKVIFESEENVIIDDNGNIHSVGEEDYTYPTIDCSFDLYDFFGYDNSLFDAYPELRELQVGFALKPTNENVLGAYFPDSKAIVLYLYNISDIDQLKITLVHEVQHAIQDNEGFSIENKGSVKSEEFEYRKGELDFLSDAARYYKFLTFVDEAIWDSANGELSAFDLSCTFYKLAERKFKDAFGQIPSQLNSTIISRFADNNEWLRKEISSFSIDELMSFAIKINDFESGLEHLTADEVYGVPALDNSTVGKAIRDINDIGFVPERVTLDDIKNGVIDFGFPKRNSLPLRYRQLRGEIEARNTARRYEVSLYNIFPLITKDVRSRRTVTMIGKGMLSFGTSDAELLNYQKTDTPSPVQSRAVDTSRYASSFMFDTTKGKYYIDAKNAYNELIEVLSAAQGENPDMAEIRKNAQLGAIFLSSLSEDLQDSFVRKSISADKKTLRASLAADTNESLFRLFFTTAESAQTVDDSARGATLPQSAKILLSPYANASTLKHEPIHVIWNLDPSIRERAKVEYKAYFEEDPDGVQIRAVVEKDPDRFGGYTADDIVRGLKRLTEDDFDYLKETDPEEALAYMFEAYDEKRDLVKYSDGIKGIMEKIAKFLHTVADKIQKFFGIDILHEANNKVFSPIFADQSKYEKFSEQAATQDIDLAQFDRPFTRTLAMSNDGSVRVLNTDRGLMITHGISIRNFRKVLSRGGRMSTPSLAIAEPLNIPSYGGAGITFIGNKDMAQRYIESGWVITAGGTGNHPKTTHINSPFGDTALARAKTINEMFTNISNFFHEINNAYDIYSGSYIDESLRKKEVMPRFTEIEDSFKSAEIESENDAINLIKETVQKLVDYKNEWEAEKEIRNISNIISEASGGLSSFDTYFENISAIYGPISSSPDRTYLVEDDGESIAVADDGRFLEDTPEDVTFFLKRRFEGRNYSKLNSLEDARRPRSYGRSYFEAKPQETVSFSDFQVALVQTADLALFEEIKKALEPFGLPVYQYGELSLNKGYNSLVSSVKGQAEQLKFQTISSALNEIKNDSKSGEEKKQKMTQYEELVYKYVMNPVVDTLKTVETWRKENNGFFADKDSISTLRAKLESNGLFHNVDIQTELTAEMKDEIKESVTKRIAYSTEDYLAWGKKLGAIGEKIHDKDQNSVFVKEALHDLFGYKEVTINGKKVIKPTGLISKILSNVKRSASTKENWLDSLAQSIIDRRNEMLKNGELVVTDYEAAHNLKPLRADVIYKLLDKSNWTASDTKKSRNTLKGNKGYDSLVFDINSMDISVADIENFIRVLTVKSGNTYLPFTAQVGVEGFGMALEGPLVSLLNYAHVSDDINKNKFQANSLDNTDEDFLKAAYNNMKGLAGNSIDSSIYLLDKSKRDLIYAIMQLKKDGLLTGIYGLDVTAEEFKKNFLDAINGLVEEAEKNAQKVETLKSAVDIDSYDATARFINDVQNLLNRQAKIVNKVVGQSGLSENEVNKLIKQVEDLQTEMQTREEKFNEEVKNGINEATNNELIKLKNEIASKDVTIADLLKKNDELKKEAKNGVSNILSKKLHLTSEQIKNMDGDTTKLIEAYNKEIENLNNKINGFKTANTNLKAMVTEREGRIKQNLNIANSMKEDFNKASVLPLFENTKKNMKHLISRATSDVQQKLDTLMDAIYKPISAGDVRRLDVRKALKFNDVFKSGTAIDDAADSYLEYREDANKLANWVASVMLQKSENGNAPFVAKTLDQLTAGQLSELHGLIADVVNDSRKYYKEANQKEVKYHSQWRKNIASEFLAYAQSSGVNIFELGEDDSIGINDSKSNKLKSLLAELIEDFRIQSAKYRNNYPTLYAYLFGGIDHEGNVWGGLNDAQNGLINQVQKRTAEINSLLINEFSNSKFFKGTLTEKNLQSNLNAVKNGYKTQLKEAEFTDEDRQSTGLKIEKVMKGKSFEYVVSVDEDNKSAMREVARWQGEIEKRRRELQDKVKKYTDKYKPAENAHNAAALVYANLLKSDSNGYDDYYSISSGTDDYFNDLLDEAEKAEKKAKNHFDKIKDGLEKAQKELELLKKAGTRPNENTSKYTTQELLGIYLIARQRGGLDRLIYATRLYTDENVGIAGSSLTNNLSVGNVIDVIKMIEEDPQFEPLKHMADKISSIVSDRFEEVRDTRFFISKGTDYIESVDDYFGFFVEEGDFDYGPDLDLDLELAKAEGSVNTNAKAGDSMVKKRTGAYGLNLRALETAKTQIYRQEYYINFGKKIENIKDLIRDEAFQSNVKIAEGREAGRRDIRELVEFTNALGNATKTVREGAFADAARIFTNNTAASAMMFRATTILIQIPTLLVSMREKHIGIKGVLKGMARAFNDDSIDRLSPQMRDRMNGYIKSIKETNNLGTIIGSQKLEKIINTTQGIGLKGLEIVDNYVAEAMWYAYYDGVQEEFREQGKDKNLTAEEFETLCANEATQRVMDITPVQQAKDNAFMYNNKNAFVRNLLLFTNQSAKMLNMFINDTDDIKHHKGNRAYYVKRLFKTIGVATMISLMNGIIKGTLFKKTKDDDDDEAEIHLLSNIFSTFVEGATDYVPFWDTLFPSSYGESTILTSLDNFRKVLFKDADERTENQMANACAYVIRDLATLSGLPSAEGMAFYRGFAYGEPFNAGYLYNNTIGELFGGDN